MEIIFGLALDETACPLPEHSMGGLRYLGPHGLLQVLETYLGLSGHPNDNEYLRIEQYRQVLRQYLDGKTDAFFRSSFEADQFATASEMLSRRDELLLSGWTFDNHPAIPPRLACLNYLEKLLNKKNQLKLAPGFADRFMKVIQRLRPQSLPFTTIYLNEPPDLLPGHFRNLFDRIQALGINLVSLTHPDPIQKNDLSALQTALIAGSPEPKPLIGDGSLLLLRGKRESDLATFLAALIRRNEDLRPACLMPDKNRSLDNALAQEGLPGMGILSASLARPTLQVLKLVPVFLWNPVDPFKVMEFVSLSVKPLNDELANRIALQMAQTPGLMGEGWQRAINAYWNELDRQAQRDKSINVAEIRRQYSFWFERRRYDISDTVPKDEVVAIFGYLERWAIQAFEDSGNKQQSLIVLYDQARRIRELLEALPETRLSHLELERIVRTIYQPAPLALRQPEKDHLPYVFQPNAIIGPVKSLMWWNFVQKEPDFFFSRWYQPERDFLKDRGILLEEPQDQNARLIWQRKRPVLFTLDRLLLVIPEYIDGSPVLQHPLYGNLEACFPQLSTITYDLDKGEIGEVWRKSFDLPKQSPVSSRMLGRPSPFIILNNRRRLDRRPEETFSSLHDLFYYPYKWVFRHKLQLRKSSILSIVPDQTLLGNLAHRFFERMMKENTARWQQEDVERWIDEQAGNLLQREGAVLLMYGREPEKVSFIRKLKYASWSLVNLIQQNGWEVNATEKPLEGQFLDIPIIGRADLVLEKESEQAVIDLKWRGATYREQIIRNEEDLQLVLYARLLTSGQTWAHTAYFIMDKGKLIARNNLAFNEINPVVPDADHIDVNQRILDRMQRTFQWRMDQIRDGRIEVRCKATQADLEDSYGEELMDLLEMKTDDAPWDDYRTLINLLE